MVGAQRAGDDAGMDERAPQPTADRPPSRWSVSQPRGLAALTVAVAYPVSLAAGAAAGLAVFGAGSAVEDCGENTMWCGLGPVLLGAGAGLIAATTSNLAVAWTLIRRSRPPGQRLPALGIHVAATVVLMMVLGQLRRIVF